MKTATATAVELMRIQPETWRAGQALRALEHTAERACLDLTVTTTYSGHAPWLLLWGPGAPDRRDLMQRHVAAGGRAIALDLAYWNRSVKTRLSIDTAHPQAWVMRQTWPARRLAQDLPFIGNLWKPTGPILLAGIGQKAKAQYGAVVDAWEEETIGACRVRWPHRAITVRPKPQGFTGSVEDVLRGVSLVVTWHSNIAVDAIRCGIPVICRDGAAAAVCPSEVPDEPTPLPVEVRDRFLANLAWFQWAPYEASACWTFLKELLA
jgi:hypothetical protein